MRPRYEMFKIIVTGFLKIPVCNHVAHDYYVMLVFEPI